MIIGVGFLLFAPINGAYKLFVVQELNSKPLILKEAGMYSFPLETFISKDICPKNTLRRLIKEEIGISPSQVKIKGFSFHEFRLIPGRKDIISLYGFGSFNGSIQESLLPEDSDINFVGWMTPEELLAFSAKRIEVEPILRHFLSNYKNLLNEPN